MSDPHQGKGEQWGSRLGVILAVAGSAVGLGNFLRFPGQAVENGGGAFMIPYFIAFVLLGIPICWAEWTMGRYGGLHGVHSCPAVFAVISRSRLWRYIGTLGVLVPLGVYFYYIVIEAWCFGYAWSYLTGGLDLGPDPKQWTQASKDHFGSFVGISADGALFSNGIAPLVFFWLIVFSLNFALMYQGLVRGIERFCAFAMPLMALIAVIVLVRVLTLGTPDPAHPELNVHNGLGFMWNPKPLSGDSSWTEALLKPSVWLAATGQIFFSLSVGFGVIINYASYLKRNSDVVLSGLSASATNELFEVGLGGMITIPAAFVFLGAAGAIGGTFGLGFNTLPVVFMHMPFGNVFGFLWFFMLFLAAITSSLSMLQPAVAYLQESLQISRRGAVSVLGIVTALGSLFVLYFSAGLTALDTIDFWIGTAGIFLLACAQVVLFVFVFGVSRGIEHANEGAEMRLPRWFRFVITYVTPTYLLAIFVGWCLANLSGYVKTLQQGGVPLLSVFLIIGVWIFLLLLARLMERRNFEKRSITP